MQGAQLKGPPLLTILQTKDPTQKKKNPFESKCGHMKMKSFGWNRRFFSLQEDRLLYFKTKPPVGSKEPPLGEILLAGADLVECRTGSVQRFRIVMECTEGPRKYFDLKCGGVQEMVGWLAALKNSQQQHSTLDGGKVAEIKIEGEAEAKTSWSDGFSDEDSGDENDDVPPDPEAASKQPVSMDQMHSQLVNLSNNRGSAVDVEVLISTLSTLTRMVDAFRRGFDMGMILKCNRLEVDELERELEEAFMCMIMRGRGQSVTIVDENSPMQLTSPLSLTKGLSDNVLGLVVTQLRAELLKTQQALEEAQQTLTNGGDRSSNAKTHKDRERVLELELERVKKGLEQAHGDCQVLISLASLFHALIICFSGADHE
jgi:hypothetical protein